MTGRAIRRIALVVTSAVIGPMLAVVASAHAQPYDATSKCPTVTVERYIPASTPVLAWSENLSYDTQGSLWVSRTLQNRVDRYDSQGRPTGSVSATSPGAIRQGPDGQMYVTVGNSPINMIPGLPLTGKILRFDPTLERPQTTTFATRLGMPNGLAFDSAGLAYVADSKLGVLRIDRSGSIDRAWSANTPKNLAPSATVNGTGMNGIVVIGDAAYVTMTRSLTGRLLRIPLDHPEATTAALDLTAPLPGIIDDLTALSETTVAVASTTGQLITADLASQQVCSAGVGAPLTSVAVTPGDPHVLVAGSETGEVLRITLHND